MEIENQNAYLLGKEIFKNKMELVYFKIIPGGVLIIEVNLCDCDSTSSVLYSFQTLVATWDFAAHKLSYSRCPFYLYKISSYGWLK